MKNSSVVRILLEDKKKVKAQALLQTVHEKLHMFHVKQVRIVDCIDVEGADNESVYFFVKQLYKKPSDEILFVNDIQGIMTNETQYLLGRQYQQGQYDQKADLIKQCLQIGHAKTENSVVRTGQFFIFEGMLLKEEKEKLRTFFLNEVDMEEMQLDIPETLQMANACLVNDLTTYTGFCQYGKNELASFLQKLQLSMSLEDILFCQQYFAQQEKRDPTETEIKLIDTYWSDHCRHTTFNTSIKTVDFEEGPYRKAIEDAFNLYLENRNSVYGVKAKDRAMSLMDIAVMGMKYLKTTKVLNNLDESDEINACTIVVPVEVNGEVEEWLILFKNETHNHPTEIEPFGGAGTCLGGAIRDPLSGRAYVYQAMRVTGSGDPTKDIADTLPGKLPQYTIGTEAASGYSSYANQIGLPAGLVQEIYHDGFVAKRMEVGAVVGAVKREYVKREKPCCGDVIVLLGGRTGRDGCGGATGSSKEHTSDSMALCSAEVQKGNPAIERNIQRLFRKPEASRLIKKCNDFGAGGVAVAIGELADGLMIQLDKVPVKYAGLTGTELAISESQERMAVVISADDLPMFIALADEENLDATPVAQVTDDGRLTMIWKNNVIVSLGRDFLDSNGVVRETNILVKANPRIKQDIIEEGDFTQKWISCLQSINTASQKGLVEMFDSTSGSNTMLLPLGGINQLTPIEAMVAKVPTNGKTSTCTLMSFGYQPDLFMKSPFHGAVFAVLDSVSKIVATGGDPQQIRLSFQEYFESLGDNPSKWGKPFAALLGAHWAQIGLQIPSIGGKDSMSGSFHDLHVPPTLISFALGIGHQDNIISPEFKKIESFIVQLHLPYDQNDLPDLLYYHKMILCLHKMIREKKIISAATVGEGGITIALSKMAFGNQIGFNVLLPENKAFHYHYGSFILEIDASLASDLEHLFAGLEYSVLGKTIDTETMIVNDINVLSIEEAITLWTEPLHSVYPIHEEILTKTDEEENQNNNNIMSTNDKVILHRKPKVIIPVFPGSNMEDDLERAFRDAGGDVELLVIRNRNLQQINESIDQLVKVLSSSHILAIGSGMSDQFGEHTDLMVASFFSHPKLQEAVNQFATHKDKLIGGFGGGFQTLLKLGLLDHNPEENCLKERAFFTQNPRGNYLSRMCCLKVISTKSPWYAKNNIGDMIDEPISTKEGFLNLEIGLAKELIKKGQIPTQYINPKQKWAVDSSLSVLGIESMTNSDGRILGKLCHSARSYNNKFFANRPKPIDEIKNKPNIFESAIHYYHS